MYYERTYAEFKAIDSRLAETLFNATTGRGKLEIGESITIDEKKYTLDYVSLSSYKSVFGTRGISVYFKVGRSIIRVSDHWSKTGNEFARSQKMNCGMIASCYWTLESAKKENETEVFGFGCGKFGYKVIGGKCALQSFKRTIEG